jgi:ketosteroid isomerase-like protein
VSLFYTISVSAQQWSDNQKEVWKSVENYWILDDSRDLNGFLEYFDESYKGWSYDTEKPLNKTELRKAVSKDYEEDKGLTTKSTLIPLEIWIKGDIAFVHYSFTRIKSKEGKSETASGRWTDILQKKGDKWVLVGDHGGVTKK